MTFHLSPDVRVCTASQPVRDVASELQAVVGESCGQMLRVRVAHEKVDALEVSRDHVADYSMHGSAMEGFDKLL